LSNACTNIGPIGIRRRMMGGVVWLIVSIAIGAMLFAMHASHFTRVWLVLPLFLSAIGFFQAQARTCVALARMDRLDADAGGPVTPDERPTLRRQANMVLIRSGLVAIAITVVLYFI
jgi:hypothetical protein